MTGMVPSSCSLASWCMNHHFVHHSQALFHYV
jgi:hypothetical protein